MKYLGAVGGGAMSGIKLGVCIARDIMGKDEPEQYSTPIYGTDKRANRNQEAYEQHLYDTDRVAFNQHVRWQHSKEQRDRDAKPVSREAKQERVAAKQAAQAKWNETAEAVREFREHRADEVTQASPQAKTPSEGTS